MTQWAKVRKKWKLSDSGLAPFENFSKSVDFSHLFTAGRCTIFQLLASFLGMTDQAWLRNTATTSLNIDHF